jgi:hypothetical protein
MGSGSSSSTGNGGTAPTGSGTPPTGSGSTPAS